MAFSRSATASTSPGSTKRNSAAGSTKRVISQGQATRSTLTCFRVTYFMGGSFRTRLRTEHSVRPAPAPGRLQRRDAAAEAIDAVAGLGESGFHTGDDV